MNYIKAAVAYDKTLVTYTNKLSLDLIGDIGERGEGHKAFTAYPTRAMYLHIAPHA